MKDVCYERGSMTREEVNEALSQMVTEGVNLCEYYEGGSDIGGLRNCGYLTADYTYFGVRGDNTYIDDTAWADITEYNKVPTEEATTVEPVCYERGDMTPEEVNEMLVGFVRDGAEPYSYYCTAHIPTELEGGAGYLARAYYSKYLGIDKDGKTMLDDDPWCDASQLPSAVSSRTTCNTPPISPVPPVVLSLPVGSTITQNVKEVIDFMQCSGIPYDLQIED